MEKSIISILLIVTILSSFICCSKEEDNIDFDYEGIGPIPDGDYYVAPWGNDDSAGTFRNPWATWQKAFETANAGDTVYFRGGIWSPSQSSQTSYRNSVTVLAPKASPAIGHTGTRGNPICFFNYPGETPILDCSNISPIDNYITGITIVQANFIHIKGLTVRNISQGRDYVEVFGVTATNCSHLIFENMTVHDVAGNAFRYVGAIGYYGIVTDSSYFINCDAYNNCDSRIRTSEGSPALGGAADGFKAWNEAGASYLEFRGCRAWNNSDDGFDPSSDATTVIDNCWSFNNGLLEGDGTGFKTGGIYNDYGSIIKRKVTNCIAAYNRATGFFLLEYPDYYRTNARFYNNTSYANLYGFTFSRNAVHPIVLGVWKNNIAYKNTELPFSNAYQQYSESNNTWDRVEGYPGYINSIEVTVNDGDFVSLNVEELKKPRKADGSLPDINFLKLAPGSDLIDAGVDVGLPYLGARPDIGYNEYKVPVSGIVVSGENGSNSIIENNGTLQLFATVLPSDAGNKNVMWSVINGTGSATISNSGLLTAGSNGTVNVRATAADGSGVFGEIEINISNQVSHAVTVASSNGLSTISQDNGTLQLVAQIIPQANHAINWGIINGTGRATINSTGLVTAVSDGTVTARATIDDGSGIYGDFQITISNQIVPVISVSISSSNGSTAIITNDGTLQLAATVLPVNATNKNVVWSITNVTGQATINTSGHVTAIDNGTVIAKATASDGTGIYGTLTINISNQTIPVTGINISSSGGLSLINTNKGTLQLTANVSPSDASNKNVTWSIQNNTGQASINSTGLVSAAANGIVTARATAKDGTGIYGTLTITISNQIINVTSITISAAGGSNSISTDNGTLQLNANVSPANATNKEVTWSMENGTGQAAINSSGLVTAINNGSITARATAKDGSGISGTLVINISNQVVTNPVTPVSSIVVTGFGGATTLLTNGNLQLNANILPENATNKNITWSIQNGTGQATINATGLVTALSAGTVTARAISTDGSGVYGTLLLTITNQVVLISNIAVYSETGLATITTDNGNLQLIAAVTPSNATNKQVSWTILNGSGQATINSSGLVTAVSDGLVTATATAMDGSGTKSSLIITLANQSISVSSIAVTGAGGSNIVPTNKGTLQMQAEVLPRNATNKMVTWNVINGTGSATINSGGLLTAVTEGTVTVTATANDGTGISGSAIVTIAPRVVKVHTIVVHGDKFKTTLENLHDTLQLYATIFPEDATNKKVHWTVENITGQASINENGVLRPVTYGTVTVKATATDNSDVFGALDITINNNTTTDIDNHTENDIHVYCMDSRLYVIQSDLKYIKASLVSLNGTLLKIESIEEQSFNTDINMLTPGLYIVILDSYGGERYTVRFRKE